MRPINKILSLKCQIRELQAGLYCPIDGPGGACQRYRERFRAPKLRQLASLEAELSAIYAKHGRAVFFKPRPAAAVDARMRKFYTAEPISAF